MQRNRGKNRKGKTRDLFKKIRDTKGTFHAKMSTIKDRKCKDLTEAERLKRARIHRRTIQKRYLLGGSDGKVSGPGKSPGEGNDNPLQYSCLGNSMDRGTWWATVHGVAKSQT